MAYGLYIHIPYCASKCRYCDFYSAPASRGVPEEYLDAVLRAFALLAPKGENGAALPPKTVYFGGGTPGLLAPEQVARVLESVRPATGAEVTLEVNPGGDTPQKLPGFFAAGVNRISVGVQTANAESLRRLGRAHTPREAAETLAAARNAGFTRLSADIMLALPHYTRAEFDETLTLCEHHGATHLSAYLLKIEPGTPFGRKPPEGLPAADEAAGFYLYAAEKMAARGYAQYEISNFAKPGGESRHNLLYWDCRNYLGLGPAAHSSLGGRRFSFAADTAAFIATFSAASPAMPSLRAAPGVGQNTVQGMVETPSKTAMNLKQIFEGAVDANDYIMLRLRLSSGLSEAGLERRFGATLTEKQRAFFARLVSAGMARPTADGFALTPEGMIVQNTILQELL